MKMTGKKVISERYGEGSVISQEGKRIRIAFDSVGEKLFAFPRAFMLDLRMKDSRSQKQMDKLVHESAEREEAARAQARAEAAAKLNEAFEQAREKKQRTPRKTATKTTKTTKATKTTKTTKAAKTTEDTQPAQKAG